MIWTKTFFRETKPAWHVRSLELARGKVMQLNSRDFRHAFLDQIWLHSRTRSLSEDSLPVVFGALYYEDGDTG